MKFGGECEDRTHATYGRPSVSNRAPLPLRQLSSIDMGRGTPGRIRTRTKPFRRRLSFRLDDEGRKVPTPSFSKGHRYWRMYLARPQSGQSRLRRIPQMNPTRPCQGTAWEQMCGWAGRRSYLPLNGTYNMIWEEATGFTRSPALNLRCAGPSVPQYRSRLHIRAGGRARLSCGDVGRCNLAPVQGCSHSLRGPPGTLPWLWPWPPPTPSGHGE